MRQADAAGEECLAIVPADEGGAIPARAEPRILKQVAALRAAGTGIAILVTILHDALDAGVARVDPVAKTIIDDLHNSRLAWLSAKSLTTHAARLQVDKKTLLQKAELHAAALYLSYLVGMRQSIARIKADVLAKGGSLVAAYLFMRCDETPLMMTVVDNDLLTLLPDELQAQLQLAQDAGYLPRIRDQGVAKLLQVEMTVVVLVEVGGSWKAFTYRPPCPILSMARCTPENYHSCLHMLQSALGFETVADGFMYQRGWRTSDGDNAVVRCKRYHGRLEMANMQAASWSNLCSVHTKNTDREEAFVGCDDITTNIKRAILSVNFANHRKIFRTALQEQLAKTIIERDAAVPLHLRRIHLTVLEHLIPDTEDNRVRRGIILGTFGSWGITGKLRVFPPEAWSDDQVRAWLMGPCLLAIMGDGPGNFPSRSWTKAEVSVRWLALLHVLGLLKPSYERFCQLCGGGSCRAGQPALDGGQLLGIED